MKQPPNEQIAVRGYLLGVGQDGSGNGRLTISVLYADVERLMAAGAFARGVEIRYPAPPAEPESARGGGSTT